MPWGESEIGIWDRLLCLKRGSVAPRRDVCCDIVGPGRFPVWVVGYGKGFLTMEIAMSKGWSSDYEQIYYLCGYQHKITKKRPKACIP